MKRFLVATVAAAAALSLAPATVGAVPYGPEDPTISIPSPTVVPGGSITVTFFGFDPSEEITVDVSLLNDAARAGESFRAPRAVVGSVTADAEGSASVIIEAPSAPGTYLVTATGAESGAVATATFTVEGTSGGGGSSGGGSTGGGSLPATGSDSNQLVQTGAVVLALGAGLVGVAALRRRRTATA
jgi:LPXTG-motif cell wall-anchored protein